MVKSQQEHAAFLNGLDALRRAACDVAEHNRLVPDLVTMDHQIALFCNDLRDCLAREESMVFPALLRLRDQRSISGCKAGAIKARLRFMSAEQNSLLDSISEIINLIRPHVSPAGPCESCHNLLRALHTVQTALTIHILREQDILFAWAIEREDQLIRRTVDQPPAQT
jgi:regulator of cell morphogenesis and NO signaling